MIKSDYSRIILVLTLMISSAQLSAAADVDLLHSFKNDTAGVSLESIVGMQFDSAGALYALDSKNATLVKVEGDAISIALADVTGGAEQGTKHKLVAFTLIDDDLIAIADAHEGSIWLLNRKGERQTDFGEKGRKAGMLSAPEDLDFSINRRVYIADGGSSEIAVYSPSGIYLYGLGQGELDPQQRLKKPEFVSVDRLERTYVLQPGKSPVIAIYEPSTKLLKRFSSEELETLFGQRVDLSAMTVDQHGNIFLADSAAGKIIQFDWQAGKIKQSFGSKGEGPGQFKEISGLAVSRDDRIAVLDERNKKLDIYKVPIDRVTLDERAWLANIGHTEFIPVQCNVAYRLHNLNILCLDEKADQVRVLGRKGNLIHELKADFNSPRHAAYDDKHIAILDKKHIYVFAIDGKYMTQFGSSGRKDGQLRSPGGLYIRNNRIYVADTGNRRVQIFSLKGVFLDKVPKEIDKENPVLEKPVAVAVDANSKIYVADEGKQRIVVFSDQNETIYEIGELKDAPGAFEELSSLALDTDNNLYVLTQTGLKEQTIQVYSGPDKVFEFGAFSKKVSTGIGKGITLSVSPTAKTVVSVFDVVDAKNPGLIAFNYLQVPPPVSELVVAGGDEVTEISWQRLPGAYIDSYKVYASQSLDGDFVELAKVNEAYAKISNIEDTEYQYYRVSGVSGFGTEGPLSAVRQNKFMLARQHLEKNELQQAATVLREDLQLNPAQPRATKLLGHVLQKQELYAEAANAFRNLRTFDNYNIEGLNLQVEALYLNKEYSEAMALAQEAVKLAKDDIASYINCGRLSIKIGDAIGAFVCLEGGQKLDANNTEIIFLMAEAQMQLGAVAQSLSLIDKAVKSDPGNAEVWIRAGEIYQGMQKSKLANEHFAKAYKLDDNNTKAQMGLANSSLALKNISQAKNIALKLAANPETESTGNYLLGVIAMHENKPAMAVIPLSKATRAQANNVVAWLALADAFEALVKPIDAEKSLRSAIDADPGSFVALKRLGLMLHNAADYSSAAGILQQAVNLNDKDYEVVLALADSLFNDKQYLRASELAGKAIALTEKNIDALMLAAETARQRGKIGDAIEYLKTAIASNKNDYSLHVQLGELYLENNIYDQAQVNLERATIIDKTSDKAFVLLGQMFMNLRSYDKAIEAFEAAVKKNSSTDNRLALDTAYAEKKRSLEFSSNAPQLVLEDLKIQPVFSAAYKQYNDKSVGSVKIRNISGVEYGNLTVSFNIKGYMDFPTSQTIAKLDANSTQEIQLLAAFNNRILEIDEDTGVQVEVKLSYVREGRNDEINATRSMTIYGKNAITWADPNMIGSFVTPKDEALRDFVRQAVNEYKPDPGPLSENVVTAMTLFSTFSAYGIRYEVDPTNPFASIKSDQVDYVQFARETLHLKSGDCDDLTVLFSAALENFGIETAVLDVPGHLLMMFNTNLTAENASQISSQDELLIIRDNKVWVPLEVTMISTSFAEAWFEGAKKYYSNLENKSLTEILMRTAWQGYQPVTLKPSSYTLKTPAAEKVQANVQREQMLLLQKSLDRQIGSYEAILANNPDDNLARMQIAIIYAKNGLYASAIEILDELAKRDENNSSVYNNRANIFFQQGDLQRAKEAYEQAERLDPGDGGIKMNLALVAYQQGKMTIARKKYKQALRLSNALESRFSTFGELLKS